MILCLFKPEPELVDLTRLMLEIGVESGELKKGGEAEKRNRTSGLLENLPTQFGFSTGSRQPREPGAAPAFMETQVGEGAKLG